MSRTSSGIAADQAICGHAGLAAAAPSAKPGVVRLGGFVIHGGEADTLGECLDSLKSVCDEVVAVLSDPGVEARAVVCARAARLVERGWEGYGSARAAAVEALRCCGYVFFLDSDERLGSKAIEALRAGRASRPTAPQYALPVYDWASLRGRRFLFRVEHHVR